MTGPQASMLPDGKRLHLNHGPIDLVIEAFGEEAEIAAAYRQARNRFATVLTELVKELPALRRPSSPAPRPFSEPTARRMEAATCRFAARFITPMAAVAGAVADEMLAAMLAGRRLERAYVNDGGDIAIFLSPGAQMKAAIAGTGHGLDDRIVIRADDPVRGIATSGWRGRSHSLGIADAVTVLARDAATADAAATLVANAVDLTGHPAIRRTPANVLSPDSDLGDRLVTTAVGPLAAGEVDTALAGGLRVAEEFLRQGLIEAAALFLNGETRLVANQPMSRSFARPSGLPAISPSRGEISRPPGLGRSSAPARDSRGRWQPISTLEGEMAGRPEGGNIERRPDRDSPRERTHA